MVDLPTSPGGPSTVRPVFADLLTVGFGTAVLMWDIGFVSRLPGLDIPSRALLFVLVGCLFAGGAVAGRWSTRGWRAGLAAGAIAQLVNLLILGSLLGEGSRLQILAWVPGSIAAGGLIGGLGGVIGNLNRPKRNPTRNWSFAFAAVAAYAVLGVIVLGGLVTGYEVGMAVPDWPETFGSLMFLYPLAKMTGGVYFEHAHRLMGSLVGLVILVLAINVWRTDGRREVRALALAGLLFVIVQGLLGGLRVTERSQLLAMIHGVGGQLVLAITVLLMATLSTTWRDTELPRPVSEGDRRHATILLAVLLVQLTLGALVRHFDTGIGFHIIGAVIVAALAFSVAGRLAAVEIPTRVLRRPSHALLALVGIQLILGAIAFAATRSADPARAAPPITEVVITTLHQSTGALMLGTVTWLWIWTRRLSLR